jgi:tetratricopeptide (TPR) repeat protein
MRRIVMAAAALALAAGCDGKAGTAKAGEHKATPAAAAPDAGAAAKPAEPAKTAAPSKAQRKAYRQHLAKGRKLGNAGKWGEAVTEFEAALAALPNDGRALSELGWAAFNAGDYDKARKANAASVRSAIDPKVKAASLYNLGRVEEATGHKDEAAKLYQESLALRPNKAVAARLASLGKTVAPDEPLGDEPFCATPMALDKVCDCILAHASYWDQLDEPGEKDCELEPAGKIAGVRVADANTSGDSGTHVLVAEGPAGWSVVATLEDVYNPGMDGIDGISEDWSLESMVVREVGGHRVLMVTTHHHRQDTDAGIYEIENDDSTDLTVCVLGGAKAKTATTCPLQVQIGNHYTRERFVDDKDLDDEERAYLKEWGTKGLPIDEVTQLDAQLGDDGTVTVVLKKGELGAAGKATLGPHKLW